MLLRLFGATIGRDAHPSPSCRIWAPWNLTLGESSSIGEFVDVYSVAPIVIGRNCTISQYSFLCTASHDYLDPLMPLTTAPIRIEDGAWVAADVFIGPGVTVGEGAVVGARSSAYKDVPAWTVFAGNPARFMCRRELRHELPGQSTGATKEGVQ
jgi:putative colanic acid biosynthesis acetyltransferase WcaF